MLGILLIIGWASTSKAESTARTGRVSGWTPETPEDRFTSTELEECHARELR